MKPEHEQFKKNLDGSTKRVIIGYIQEHRANEDMRFGEWLYLVLSRALFADNKETIPSPEQIGMKLYKIDDYELSQLIKQEIEQ
jgi:hypothetical protein